MQTNVFQVICFHHSILWESLGGAFKAFTFSNNSILLFSKYVCSVSPLMCVCVSIFYHIHDIGHLYIKYSLYLLSTLQKYQTYKGFQRLAMSWIFCFSSMVVATDAWQWFVFCCTSSMNLALNLIKYSRKVPLLLWI